jgi:hypothetical protein
MPPAAQRSCPPAWGIARKEVEKRFVLDLALFPLFLHCLEDGAAFRLLAIVVDERVA